MLNLKLVENQPRWRVWLIANLAKIIGVMIHVEGIPFGSSRNYSQRGEATGTQGATVPLRQGASGSASTEDCRHRTGERPAKDALGDLSWPSTDEVTRLRAEIESLENQLADCREDLAAAPN